MGSMNDFHKEQHKTKIEQTTKKCLLCSGVTGQSKKRITDFYDAILDNTITAEVIVKVLKTWGVASSVTNVKKHRSGVEGYAAHMETIKKAAGL